MLEGKVAVVTGGTRGIGFATVEKFLENGAKVFLLGSKKESVDNAVKLYSAGSTGTAILAECAVKDRIWGIGLSMKDLKRFDITQWRGQNLLGYALMEVRKRL